MNINKLFGNLSFTQSMTGEWCPDEENSEKPPPNNNMLGHVLHRLMEIFYPPKPVSSPAFPPFPIKGCILGKPFSGKTTCVKFIEKGRVGLFCLFVHLFVIPIILYYLNFILYLP